jgi:hypothetical protein
MVGLICAAIKKTSLVLITVLGLRSICHHILQCADVFLGHLPILSLALFSLLVTDRFTEPLKGVDKAVGRGLQIVVYVPFNKDPPMGIKLACCNAQPEQTSFKSIHRLAVFSPHTRLRQSQQSDD